MTDDRIPVLGATVAGTFDAADVPGLVARIARLWAELYCFDPDLALELARKLPAVEISR